MLLVFIGTYRDSEEDSGATEALARRLEEELRAAKSAQLSCGEVLLPADLLPRVARDVLNMAENEPCGLRLVLKFDYFYSVYFTCCEKKKKLS